LQTIGGNDTCQSVWQRWRQRQQDLHSPITTDTESDSDSDKDDNEICCVEKGCGQIFADVCAYEEHYEREHRHQCGVCGRKFLTERCLEIHADETHSWLFQAQLHANFQKNEAIALYRCFDSACSKAFVNSDERSLHSLKEHFIEDGGAIESQKRKAARKAPSEQNASKGSQLCAEIGEALDEIKMSPSSAISSKDHVTAR
uniref:C2H2-type domain-containing protein n=1 Tax=Anisakis simplex TaxID=6269 RepID=A0A0M3JIR3_ANISI